MKYTGFFKASIISVSPSKDELIEITGEDLEEEPLYIWKDRQGERHCKIDIYLEYKEDVFKHTIELVDKDFVSKNGSICYINCLGITQWVNNEDQLWESFKQWDKVLSWKKDGSITEKYVNGAQPYEKEFIANKPFRIAKVGEKQLLHLVKMLNPEFSLYNPDVDLFLDLDRLFEGDFRQLNKLIRLEQPSNFVAFAYVNEKLEQKIWEEFLPLNIYRDILNNMSISQFNKKIYNEWLKNLEYGCKGHYELTKIQPFKTKMIKKDFSNEDSDY